MKCIVSHLFMGCRDCGDCGRIVWGSETMSCLLIVQLFDEGSGLK